MKEKEAAGLIIAFNLVQHIHCSKEIELLLTLLLTLNIDCINSLPVLFTQYLTFIFLLCGRYSKHFTGISSLNPCL